jgi:hypothetical protein
MGAAACVEDTSLPGRSVLNIAGLNRRVIGNLRLVFAVA